MHFFTKSLLFCIALSIGHTLRRNPDPDSIIFRDSSEYDHPNFDSRANTHHHHQNNFRQKKMPEGTYNDEENTSQIPLELVKQLNEVANVSDFLENFVEGDEVLIQEFSLQNRFGSVERTAAVIPKVANCKTTPQIVELSSSNDSSLFYFPSCTRVERCSGCCSHSLLSCQAIQTEMLTFQVIVSQYTANGKLQYKDKEIVFVEQHKKCKCDCIIKEKDCNTFQRYDAGACRCVCSNVDERRKCESNNNTRLWDPQICKCRCRRPAECSTGYIFDENKCGCTAAVKRRFAELGSSNERDFTDKESYDVDSLAVYPLTKLKPNKE